MEFFNIESCEGTEELESSLKNQMIGSTMYDKRWVLNLVFQIGSNKDIKSKEFLSDLSSLSEMSVDADVSEFLFSSGALDIIWNQIANYEGPDIKELISLILVNCGSNDKVISSMITMDQYFLPPFYMIECESAPFLINIFRYLRLLVNALLSCLECGESEEDKNYNDRIETIERVISDPSYQHQLCFIYGSSSNNQLLLRSGLFLLSLTELFCEIGREECLEMIFSDKKFIISFFEALKQSMSKENQSTMFVYIELIGHYSNLENVDGIATDLCSAINEILNHYIQDTNILSTVDLDMLGTLLKICAISWNHVAHEESYMALLKLSEKLEAFPCEKHVALMQNTKKCLNNFQDKFPGSSSLKE